jgi:hypothetical protein
MRSLGHERLLVDAVHVLAGRDPASPRERVHDLGDRAAQRGIELDRAPAGGRDGGDRAIVVRGPEAPRGQQHVVPLQRTQAVDDLVLAVADEQHLLQVDAEPVERAREEARVAIRDEPQQQLAAGDQDRGSGPRAQFEQPPLGTPAGARVGTSPPLAVIL